MFKDCKGRTWDVSVNVATVKRVRDMLDEDLLKAADGELMHELAEDPVRLVNLIYVICKPHADERKISDEDFGEAMSGDPIGDATDALLEALCDFFPEAKRRILRKILKKVQKVRTRGYEMAEKALDNPALDRKIDEIMNKEMNTIKKKHGILSGNSQEKSG